LIFNFDFIFIILAAAITPFPHNGGFLGDMNEFDSDKRRYKTEFVATRVRTAIFHSPDA
jgi:hypothetical protein